MSTIQSINRFLFFTTFKLIFSINDNKQIFPNEGVKYLVLYFDSWYEDKVRF